MGGCLWQVRSMAEERGSGEEKGDKDTYRETTFDILRLIIRNDYYHTLFVVEVKRACTAPHTAQMYNSVSQQI